MISLPHLFFVFFVVVVVSGEQQTLELIREASVQSLLGEEGSVLKNYEASGISLLDTTKMVVVVLDNSPNLVVVNLNLSQAHLVHVSSDFGGFEGVTFDFQGKRNGEMKIFTIVESVNHSGHYQGVLFELDKNSDNDPSGRGVDWDDVLNLDDWDVGDDWDIDDDDDDWDIDDDDWDVDVDDDDWDNDDWLDYWDSNADGESWLNITKKKESWLETTFQTDNKGFEGLALVKIRGGPGKPHTYLFALCEGNKCASGSKGRTGGSGRIHVFRKASFDDPYSDWIFIDTIKLPKTLLFEDYSGIDVTGNTIAVVSQQMSKLWIGRFEMGVEEDFYITDNGVIYDFPRDSNGEIMYCTIEGVAFASPHQFFPFPPYQNRVIYVVSDQAKKSYPQRCKETDQSVHIFRIPE